MEDYYDWGFREVVERLESRESKVRILISKYNEELKKEEDKVIIDRTDKVVSDERIDNLKQMIADLEDLI